MANSLPHLYSSGQAGKIEFDRPVQMSGVISVQKTNRQTHNVYPMVRFDKYHAYKYHAYKYYAFEQKARERATQSQRTSSR
jgi:hypothetical protein